MSKSKAGFVYILLLVYKSGKTATYIGETYNLTRRFKKHKSNILGHKTRTTTGKAERFFVLGAKWFPDRKAKERELKDAKKQEEDKIQSKLNTIKLGLTWDKEYQNKLR